MRVVLVSQAMPRNHFTSTFSSLAIPQLDKHLSLRALCAGNGLGGIDRDVIVVRFAANKVWAAKHQDKAVELVESKTPVS
jgi:hypothetical protein